MSSAAVGNLNLLLGGKTLEKSDWGALTHKHGEFGLEFDVSTSELDLGVRKVWSPTQRLRTSLAGGLALGGAKVENTDSAGIKTTTKDGGAGGWLAGAIYWTLSGAFNLGLELRLSSIEVKMAGVAKNAGGGHLGLLWGWHWGGGAPK